MTEPLMPTTHAGCPFCMATSFTFQTVKDGGIYILCCCGTPGPVCKTEILARIAWNTRPGEKAARVEALEEAKQAVQTFVQSHFYETHDGNDKECLLKDVSDAFDFIQAAKWGSAG